MKRLIDYALLEWKQNPSRKPLLVRGARQVGKTYALRVLGKTYESFVEVNLEENEYARQIIERDYDVQRIILQLSEYLQQEITPGKTLLFFDEIQASPRAITALRYFYERLPQLHVAAAGSLLEFALEQVGVPVGRIESRFMYPLSFVEFLAAQGNSFWLKALIQARPEAPLSAELHVALMNQVSVYLAVGGMPEAVSTWLAQKTSRAVMRVHATLLESYQQDFGKYAAKHQMKYLDQIFQKALRQLGTKFIFAHVGDYKKRELAPAVDLLVKAGVLHKVFKTSAQGVPLGAEAELDDFKIIFLDCALAQAQLGLDPSAWLIGSDKQFANQGALIEAFVGQELLAYSNWMRREQLFYWRRDIKGSDAEVDYVVQHNQSIVPIEVKAGANRRIKSMYLFLESRADAALAPAGIRIWGGGFEKEQVLSSYPLYAIICFMLVVNHELQEVVDQLIK